jgi:DUF1365 family protein
MTNVVIRILTILIMIPIMCISITIAIIWNCYLGINYIGVRLKRKGKAGIKKVKKTNVVR